MNKLFTKIATFAIGAFMAVGVGVAATLSGSEPIEARAETGTVTLSIAGTTGTLSGDEKSISWNDGNVTFTNNKGSTAIRTSDSDHYRLYSGSSATITAPGNITKIVATCTSDAYATVFETSAGQGATVSGSIVTIIPQVSSTTYSISSFTAQTRVTTIAVTYGESSGGEDVGGDEPQDPVVGDAVSVDFSSQGYENQQEVSSVKIDENISVTFDKGTNSNNTPKYFTTGTAIRVYGGSFFTVSAIDGYSISKIVLTFGTGDGSNTITTHPEETYTDGTWNGDSQTVTFTIGGTTGHRRIKGLAVTYSVAEVKTPAKLVAEWKDGKGTYVISDKNYEFSTAHLTVTSLTETDETVKIYDTGTGFKVTLDGVTTLDATSEVKTLDARTMTAGEHTLRVTIDDLTPATLTINIVIKDTVSLEWNAEQADTFVSYIDALELKFTVTAKYNDGSGAVSDENITAVLYDGNSNTGTQLHSFVKKYGSYSEGFNVTAENGISADSTINKRLTYNEPHTFYLEVYVTNYPAVKLGKVLNVVMPTMEVSDANDFNYYVGTEYELAANARLVHESGKERVLDADEFTLDKDTVTPVDINDITVTATFNEFNGLTSTYTITPKAPVTIEVIDVFDNDGNSATVVMFDAGDEFKLFNAADAEHFLHALDSEANDIFVNTYADITFVIADDAEGTNSKPLEVGDTMFMGMDGKYVIVTYTQGESSASTSYELMIAEAEVTPYEAPTPGSDIVKATSIEVGDVVYLVCKTETESLQLSGISTTSTKYGIGVTYTTTPDSETYPLTVVAGSTAGTYAFKNGADLYLYWTKGNSLNVNATLNEETSWTVDFDEGGNAIIQNCNSGNDSSEPRRIAWNISDTRFANYKNSTLDDSRYADGYATVQIYKSNATAGNGVEYIQSVIDTYRLNSTLENEYGLSICHDDSKIYASGHWTTVKEVYEGLSEADKAILSTTHDKYAVGNVTYADTMDMLIANDPSTSQLFGVGVLKGKSSDVILVVALISITSTVLVVGYILNKKRVSNSK